MPRLLVLVFLIGGLAAFPPTASRAQTGRGPDCAVIATLSDIVDLSLRLGEARNDGARATPLRAFRDAMRRLEALGADRVLGGERFRSHADILRLTVTQARPVLTGEAREIPQTTLVLARTALRRLACRLPSDEARAPDRPDSSADTPRAPTGRSDTAQGGAGLERLGIDLGEQKIELGVLAALLLLVAGSLWGLQISRGQTRRNQRFACRLPAEVSIGGKRHQVTILDISRVGAKISVSEPVGETASTLELQVGPYWLSARTVWANRHFRGLSFDTVMSQHALDTVLARPGGGPAASAAADKGVPA